jgi:cell wall-associated NlpC family hydrolase
LRYAEPKNFLTVVAKDYTLKADGAQVLFQQGARLQLADKKASAYTVKVPVRTKEGKLQEEKVVLAANASLHEGYLPYTTNNIIRSAFKFYDSVYGWGGLQQSVDCSSFISNAYRTVGIFLPRNADEQETSAGIHKKMGNMSSAQRANVIKGLTPGSTLHMDGHVMLYLGSSNEIPYAIHSLGSHYTGGTRHSVMKVVVSDLNLQKSNGNTYLDELTTCVTFR